MSNPDETPTGDEVDFLDQFDTISATLVADMKGKDRPCPMCDADDWRIEVREKDGEQVPAAVFVMKDPRSHWGAAPSIPAIAFSCGNCGFIRLHNIPLALKSIPPGSNNGE